MCVLTAHNRLRMLMRLLLGDCAKLWKASERATGTIIHTFSISWKIAYIWHGAIAVAVAATVWCCCYSAAVVVDAQFLPWLSLSGHTARTMQCIFGCVRIRTIAISAATFFFLLTVRLFTLIVNCVNAWRWSLWKISIHFCTLWNIRGEVCWYFLTLETDETHAHCRFQHFPKTIIMHERVANWAGYSDDFYGEFSDGSAMIFAGEMLLEICICWPNERKKERTKEKLRA